MITKCLPHINPASTEVYVHQLLQILDATPEPFVAARSIAREFLGARKIGADQALFGFWVPGLAQGSLKGREKDFHLALFCPEVPLGLELLERSETRKIPFQRFQLQLQQAGDYLIAVVDNVAIGSPQRDGALYWLVYSPPESEPLIMRDPLAQSLPLGVYAPAELYDIAGMLNNRRDLAYFETHYQRILPDGSFRAKDIGITLEIHPETATKAGTLASLTSLYQAIADKMQANLEAGKILDDGLTPVEKNFIAFDTVELTPEVPPVERESIQSTSGEFFQIQDDRTSDKTTSTLGETVQVIIRKPDISNWGYDTPILGTAAVNPSILKTGRPHELLAFIETLHTMPSQPIQISLDAVLGHADFQGAQLLATPEAEAEIPRHPKYVHSAYFRGANMYGRDLDYANPVVRAILLEMLQRKVNFGFDCIRVDGGQDFVKEIDPETGYRIQDDAFIREMVNMTHEIELQDGRRCIRRLDMNVEDGRPWPNDLNWLYNATYIEHILLHALPYGDRVKQWGSLIFAHNVHGKFKWFQTKWDRFKDTFKDGQDWITGHSNHDNARYFYRLVKPAPGSAFQPGYQVDEYYNDALGKDLNAAAHEALDNPALSAVVLGFLPGSPMFFLNALFRTPWLFFRNTDYQYGVKVVADEGSRFLTWYIHPSFYAKPEHFIRLKALGFTQLDQLIQDPQSSHRQPGFLDVLFALHEQIKTDPTTVLFFFDDVPGLTGEGFGGFPSLEILKSYVDRFACPVTEEEREAIRKLQAQISEDLLDSQRRVVFAKKLIQQTLSQSQSSPDSLMSQKLAYLQTLINSDQDDLLALMLQDSSARSAYDIAEWGSNPALIEVAPARFRGNNPVLSEARLREFAMAFMLDAQAACQVFRYADGLDPVQVDYNLSLRRFRQENPWLAKNPLNDVALDFFNRKILANGAKNTGAFFSDQGDTLNANTLYYGWRTHPEKNRQIFLLANMEGQPIARLPLADFLPRVDNVLWRVVASSPGLGKLPEFVDDSLVLTQITNGQALLLERNL